MDFVKENYCVDYQPSDNFEEMIKSDVPVIVDFWSEWCKPCKELTPILEGKLSELRNFKLLKVNVDENEELAEQYVKVGIPHIIIFKNGKLVEEFVGAKCGDTIIDRINSF